MINNWLEKQDDIVLARLAGVKPKDWNSMIPRYERTTGNKGCLICHAYNIKECELGRYFDLIQDSNTCAAELVYMKQVNEFSQEQVGIEISTQAEAILSRRCVEDVIATLPTRLENENARHMA